MADERDPNELAQGSDERAAVQTNEENRARPFNTEPVETGAAAVAETYDEDGEITRTYHKPGSPIEDEQADAESAEQSEEQDEADEALEDLLERTAEVSGQGIDARSPAVAYATKGNIVHPGPLGSALADEQAAQDSLGDDARVTVDPSVVPREEDQTAAEAVEEAREAQPDEPEAD